MTLSPSPSSPRFGSLTVFHSEVCTNEIYLENYSRSRQCIKHLKSVLWLYYFHNNKGKIFIILPQSLLNSLKRSCDPSFSRVTIFSTVRLGGSYVWKVSYEIVTNYLPLSNYNCSLYYYNRCGEVTSD